MHYNGLEIIHHILKLITKVFHKQKESSQSSEKNNLFIWSLKKYIKINPINRFLERKHLVTVDL